MDAGKEKEVKTRKELAMQVRWDQYDTIYQAEVDELQRIVDALQVHVGSCDECAATIDAAEEIITGTLCEAGKHITKILEEHRGWDVQAA